LWFFLGFNFFVQRLELWGFCNVVKGKKILGWFLFHLFCKIEWKILQIWVFARSPDDKSCKSEILQILLQISFNF
jgi:hypothetical protein